MNAAAHGMLEEGPPRAVLGFALPQLPIEQWLAMKGGRQHIDKERRVAFARSLPDGRRRAHSFSLMRIAARQPMRITDAISL
jgi:hypothetical protein